MDLLSFLRGLSHDGLQPGDTIEVLDDSGDTVEATYESKGKHAGGRVVVTYTQGRYTGVGQYVERERIVGKKAEPGFAHHEGWKEMKEAREHIAAAVLFTLLVVGPASLIAGIILLVSNNDAISSIIFFSVFAVDLLAVAHWSRRQTARQQQKKGTSLLPEAQMTVHAFITHMKMYPELLPPGMTEFDLERFRKLCSGTSQGGIDHWVEQCNRRIHEQHS